MDIDADNIVAYQQKRLADGASPKTVNLEFGTLRAIAKRAGAWPYLQADMQQQGVGCLPGKDDVGRAISSDEEKALLEACGKSRSRSLLPFVTLAIETGARFNVIRTLTWGTIDFANRCVRFGKDKTPSGTGRIIPLNARAMLTLTFWASNFPDRKPEHYVFPAEKYGAAGDEFVPKTYKTNPAIPLKDNKEAWEAAKIRAAKILNGVSEDENGENGETECAQKKIEPLACRFHDLRHTAISRMLDAGWSIAKIAKIVGWSPATMVRMAARYGHFSLEELRGAVESISRNQNPEISATHTESPVNPPVSDTVPKTNRAN